jgi:tRNA (mo5U34)-methyltransferase
VSDRRHVAFATNDAYLPYAATAIRSCVRRHDTASLHVHVLHDDRVTHTDGERLAEMVAPWNAILELHRIDPAPLVDIPRMERFGGAVVWAPIVLPDVLSGVHRALFLDADLLVVRPLDDLWSVDLGGLALGAVANVVEPRQRARLVDLGLAPDEAILNSGVLVLDLDRWRTDGLVDVVLDTARGRELEWADQDALNLALAGRWQPLAPRWNAQTSLWAWPTWADEVFGAASVAQATADPAVVHFEGPLLCKPWHVLCSHPWRDQFLEELRATPWRDQPLEGRTATARAIRALPRSWWAPAYFGAERVRRSVRARTAKGLGSAAMSGEGTPIVRSFRSSHLDVTVRLPAALRRLKRGQPAPPPGPLPRLELPEERPTFTIRHEDPDAWLQRWEPSPEQQRRAASLAATPPPHALADEVAAIGWYHTLELSEGITTDGIFDHRDLVPHYGLPDDLRGQRAIDVATFDGFWAFELERRGAEVTAVDLPTLEGLDLNVQMKGRFVERGLVRDPSDGFRLAARVLGSRVALHKSSVYDLDPEVLGQFDFLHMGDLLLHLRDPIRALERVRSLVAPGGRAHIVDSFEPELAGRQATRYEGGWDLGTWWTPSLDMLAQALVDVGFADVQLHRTYRANWTDEVGRGRAILIATT